MNSGKWISKNYLFGYFFFAVFIFLIYNFIRILAPFVDAILFSSVLAMICFPIRNKIKAKMPRSPNVSAAVSTVAVLMIVVVPLTLIGWLLVKESKHLVSYSEKFLTAIHSAESSPINDMISPRLDMFLEKMNIDIQQIVSTNIRSIGEKIANSGGTIAKNLAFFVMDIIALVLVLFMFFRDGDKLVRRLIELAPMDVRHKQTIATRLYETIVAVVRGVLLTAAIQGTLAAIGYTICGVPAPISAGVATGLAALFPFGGSALVWLPLSIYWIFFQSAGWGIFLLLWSAIIVGLLDNLIRPVLIGAQAKLPVILLFLAVLGGLRTYGFKGILLGPLVVACVIAFVQIYRQEFKAMNNPPNDKPLA
ncbi:MAG: AI-2E family transporter [Elusimicrobia bacterium]|nr:AI-2E family transporter [Elusimicrobiota bacterium]